MPASRLLSRASTTVSLSNLQQRNYDKDILVDYLTPGHNHVSSLEIMGLKCGTVYE